MNKEIELKEKEYEETEKAIDKIYNDRFNDYKSGKITEQEYKERGKKETPAICELMTKKDTIEEELVTLKAKYIEVGDYVSLCSWTDWHSYKVIARTAKTLTIQENKQTHFKESWQDGELESEDDPNGATTKLCWSEKHHWWHKKSYRVALGKRDYEDPTF